MPSKARKIFPDLETQKIGRRLDPEVSSTGVLERPLESPRLGSDRDLPPYQKDGRSSIGRTIRLIRKERGITQEELARMAHVDRTTVARIECGIFKSLSVERLEGIASAVGVDLKTLFLKADSMGEAVSFRSHLSRIEFTLEYPADGFRIHSHLPRQKEFFFGRIVIEPQKTVVPAKLPHPRQIYLHSLEGKLLLILNQKELLLKPGDCLAFPGFGDYELYNPDQFKPASALFITYPSFLTL